MRFPIRLFPLMGCQVKTPTINSQHNGVSYCNTLASRIDVGPTFINFGFFSRPYGLIREYLKVILMVIYYIEHVYLRPCVYLFLPNFPGPMFIPCPTSIPEARVLKV